MVHEKQNNYTCPVCQRAFGQASNLKNHIEAVHEKVKQQSCSLCTKSFFGKSGLARHIRVVHAKEKNHVCSVCGRLFSRMSSLKHHVKVLHLEGHHESSMDAKIDSAQGKTAPSQSSSLAPKSYRCHICDLTFGLRAELKDHNENIHG